MKSFTLTVISILLILLTINVGYYYDWVRARPVSYWSDFLKEKDDTLDIDGIRKSRYGFSYTLSTKIKEVMAKRGVSHPVILFEPNSYYRDSLHIYPNIKAPEPAVFYYYTGMEGLWINSPDTARINFLVRVTKKGVTLEAIRTPQQREAILTYYRKFIPIL
jgi:hypothetical protein